MSSPPPSVRRPADLLPLLLLPALAALFLVLPPETRGESQAGTAALVGLATVAVLGRGAHGAGLRALALGLAALAPLVAVAQSPGRVPEAWATLVLAAAAGTLAAAVPPGRDRAFVLTLATVGAVVGLWGALQTMFGLNALAERLEAGLDVADRARMLIRARGGRAFAGFPTPAALGGCLILTLPITLGAAVDRAGARRAALVGSAILQACGLAAARSATATGALAAACLLSALFDRTWRRRAIVLGVGAAALLALVVVARGREVARTTGPDSAWGLRAGNARIAVEMILDHPWVGVGAGGYGEAFPYYRRATDNESQHAHVVPLELCADWGVPLGILGTVVLFGVFLGPVARGPSGTGGWRRGAAVGLAALGVQSLADFTLLLPSLLWTAALVRGRLAAGHAEKERRSPPVLSLAAAGATLAAAFVLALGGLAWNERFEARQALAGRDAEHARRHAGRATVLAPWNADGWLLLGNSVLAIPPVDRDVALAAAERAVAVAPTRPAARGLRARVRLLYGDLPGALADATEAARLYPVSPDYARARDELATRFRGSGDP